MKHSRWAIALVLVSMFVFAIYVVANAWPDGDADEDIAEEDIVDASVLVNISLDSIDPAGGTLKVSIAATADAEALAPEGATLLTSLPGVEPIALPGGDFIAPDTSTVHVDGGDVDEYPFDDYQLTIALSVTKGGVPANHEAILNAADVPTAVQVQSGLSGFDATADLEQSEGGITEIHLQLERRGPTIAWAVSMMAIYWMLASAALAVAVAILLGIRPFETRHLAWLTTIIFAFAAFRNTAPGAPPIGVFFDFASFFWAVGIVVTAELLLLTYYLFRKDKEP